jgi:SAM-dependent methyltransferase
MRTSAISTENTGTDGSSTGRDLPDGHRWEEAGAAWGRRARDWACLFEHYATEAIFAILDRVGANCDVALLDIACGSGLAVRLADARGVRAAGIDAAASLVDIARVRTPGADLRVGTMFELPWEDESFDAVTAINGIWGGCEAALDEANRVLKPGGRIGLSFWGDQPPLDLRTCFIAFAKNSPADHLQGMKRTNDISRPGVAEEMLEDAGFEVVERDHRLSVIEWPDEETAWRAISSVGPAMPALEHVGPDALRPVVLDALEGCRDAYGIYRFCNRQEFVIAEKPTRSRTLHPVSAVAARTGAQ